MADRAEEMERERVFETLTGEAARGLRIATRLVGAADAEDAVQEAMFRTIYGRRVEEPVGWFIRTLVNHCIGIQRRQRVWRLFVAPPAEGIHGADEQLGAARRQADLRRVVARLPVMQRTVIQLRFGEEMAVAEVAAALGIGQETVKTHLARAMERLRNEMGRL